MMKKSTPTTKTSTTATTEKPFLKTFLPRNSLRKKYVK